MIIESYINTLTNIFSINNFFLIIIVISNCFFSVRAFDTKNPAKGPVFTFEVTIVRPLQTNTSGLLSYDSVTFDESELIKRHFVLVPNKVSWASKYIGFLFTNVNICNEKTFILFLGLHIKHLDTDVSANFCLHTVQLIPQKSCKFLEYCKMFNMKSNEFQAHFPVEVSLTIK